MHAEIGVGESESDPLPVSHTLNHVGDLASRKASSRKAKGAIHVINIQDLKPHEGIRSFVSRRLRSKAERDSGLKGGGRGRERKILALRSEELQYRQRACRVQLLNEPTNLAIFFTLTCLTQFI